jgi:hypothetical protein
MVGTCIICDAKEDLVPICITCTNEKVTMVAEKGCNSPSTDVSQEFGTPTQETIKKALNRLKDEFGYGCPDGHE